MAKKKKAVPAASPVPTIYEARLQPDGGVQKVREISLSDAVALRQRGHEVVVCGGDLAANRSLAESIEQQANGRWKRCPPHASAGTNALPHYQPELRGPAGHTFYETPHRQAVG